MSEVKQEQDRVLQEFSDFFDWEERFEHICELGKTEINELPQEKKRDEFLVKGCSSKVWLIPSFREDRLFFEADSDSIFVRGLVALVLRVYSGKKAEDILQNPPDFLKEAGLMTNLSPNRANGLASMIQVIQGYAESYRQSPQN